MGLLARRAGPAVELVRRPGQHDHQDGPAKSLRTCRPNPIMIPAAINLEKVSRSAATASITILCDESTSGWRPLRRKPQYTTYAAWNGSRTTAVIALAVYRNCGVLEVSHAVVVAVAHHLWH